MYNKYMGRGEETRQDLSCRMLEENLSFVCVRVEVVDRGAIRNVCG